MKKISNSQRLLSAFCVLCIMLVGSKVFSQTTVAAQNGCFYLKKDRPLLFISYEKEVIEENEKSQKSKVVLLRLHNNSTCSIEIETTDITHKENLFRKEINNLSNGSIETKYIPNLSEGARLPIFYDIQKGEGKSIVAANYWEDRHIKFTYTIPSGLSAIFSVEASHFQKRFKISVPYSYSWEESSALRTWGTITHRVFYVYDLPKGFYIE